MDFKEVFFQYAQENSDGILSFLNIREIFEISSLFDLSQLQNSDLYRTHILCLHIAFFVIDEDGDLILDKVDYCLQKASISKAILHENNLNDSFLIENVINVLKYLTSHKAFIKKFKKLSMPLCHKQAEDFVRNTLILEEGQPLTDAHIKRATLCTLMSPLRQTVGSCFATACGIYLQKLDIYQMFLDIEELIKMGSLTRVISGRAYLVPFNSTMGMGELKKHLFARNFLNIANSPSLLYAFGKASHHLEVHKETHKSASYSPSPLMNPKSSLYEKRERLNELIFNVLEENQVDNLYQLIDAILLKHFDLKNEDFLAKKRLEKTEYFIASHFHPSMVQKNPPKRDKVEEYEKTKKIILSSFQSYVDSPLLKAWEYTLASFCDVKREFTLWNLYSSLGFSFEERAGIGGFLYSEIDKKLKNANSTLIAYYEEATLLEGKIRANQAVLYRTETQSEEMRLRSEMGIDAQQLQFILDKKDRAETQVRSYQELFSYLIKSYIDLFESYFQEVYDPDMIEQSSVDYNDSPAGFRLLATHNRKDPFSWSSIQNQDEFIQELRNFFMSTENSVVSAFPEYDLHSEISSLITEMIQYIQSPIFIEYALKRVQKTHQQALGHVNKEFKDKVVQKPWGYISGGTLDTLVAIYFKKDILLKKERVIESPVELFIFLVELLLEANPVLKKQITKKNLSFLMYNGGHAFLFCPYFSSFKNAWQTEKSPTDILQDLLDTKAQEFVSRFSLNEEMQRDLLSEFIKDDEQRRMVLSTYTLKGNLSINEFSHYFLTHIGVKPEICAAFLYSTLLTPQNLSTIHEIFDELPFDSLDRRVKAKSFYSGNPLNALSLQKELKKCLIQAYESVCMPYDYHKEILSVLEKQKKIYPRPILFADTNWPCYYFGFLPNPISLELEFWRFDTISAKGYPVAKELSFFGSIWGVILDQLIYEK